MCAPNGLTSSHRDLKHWLLDWISSLEEKELAISLMVLYHRWLARNDARKTLMIEDPDKIARRALMLTEEWMALKDPVQEKVPRQIEH
jgi:hypothetical protein